MFSCLSLLASPAVVVQDAKLLPRNPFETFRPASDIQVGIGSEKWYFQAASVGHLRVS